MGGLEDIGRRNVLSCLLLLGFWLCFVGFDGVDVFCVTASAADVNSYLHFLCILLVDACFFEFFYAESLAGFDFAVSFCYDWFNVVHTVLLPLAFNAVVFTWASLVAWTCLF